MKQIIKLIKSVKKFTLKSEGLSMQPIFFSGDIIYGQKRKYGEIRINDLIIVNRNNKITTHRVIFRTDKYLITKGDANPQADGKIYPSQIIGRVYNVKRNGTVFYPDSLYLLQSTNYFREILRIKEAFEKENVDMVFLKGLPLHLYYEKSHPRRIYADCDILIKRNSLIFVKEILTRFGYHEQDHSLSDTHKKFKGYTTELAFYKKINSFFVIFDIHIEITPLYNKLGDFDSLYSQYSVKQMTAKFFAERRKVKILGEYFPILSPESIVVFLAVHLFRHVYRGCSKYDFLDKVIRKERNKNYELRIMDIIKEYQLQNFVYPVFLFLKKYYSTPLSEKFLESIKPDKGKLKYIRKNIMTINIFDDETRISSGVARFRNLFFLSPNPLWGKLLIIFNPAVVYSVFWVMIFFLRRSAMRSFTSVKAFFSFIPYRLTKRDTI